MNKIFHEAFEPICATEGMKQNINAFIHSKVAKRQYKVRASVRYALVCCAMLAIVVCGIGGYNYYQTPVSYISVDVNPSVELGLNRLDCVVTAIAYNDDGALILQNLSLKNKSYTKAVELLLSDETFANYLSEDAQLSFTVVSDKEDVLLAGIQQCQGYAESNATCHRANAKSMEEAHHNRLSVGKYKAYLELAAYDKTITPEDCQRLSMREIRNLIGQHESGEDAVSAPVSGGQGNDEKGQGCSGNNGSGWGNGHHRGMDDGNSYRDGIND